MNCPKCGSPGSFHKSKATYECGSYQYPDGDGLADVGDKCMEMQLHNAKAQLAASDFSSVTLYDSLSRARQMINSLQTEVDLLNTKLYVRNEQVAQLITVGECLFASYSSNQYQSKQNIAQACELERVWKEAKRTTMSNNTLETQPATSNASSVTLYEELELTKKRLSEALMTCDALNWRMLAHREYLTKLEEAARLVVGHSEVKGNIDHTVPCILIKRLSDALNMRKETK